MIQRIAARALAEWTIYGLPDNPRSEGEPGEVGITFKAPEPRYTCSPGELDKHLTFPIGEWILLPANDWQKLYQRLKAQSHPSYCPTIQRFEFEIRQMPEPGDELDEALADIPIRKPDGTVSENPWKAARAAVEETTAENAKLKGEVVNLGEKLKVAENDAALLGEEVEKLRGENAKLKAAAAGDEPDKGDAKGRKGK